MATSEKTKKDDERLRQELAHADLGKFKKILRLAIKAPAKKPLKRRPK